MGIALLGFGSKDMDQLLAMVMFVLVAAAAGGVIVLLCRHSHSCRKAKKHADHNHRAKNHPR